MAEVQLARHHRHSSIGPTMSATVTGTEPVFEMVPNPTFSFPMRPPASSPACAQPASFSQRRRPNSMHLGLPGAQPGDSNPHRRTTSALPSFSFNAGDATGLCENATPPRTPDEASPLTPRRGHRRGGSEFVGGDSRFGVSNAISTSPTSESAPTTAASSNALPVPQFNGRRGHAHRRSAALSSHDVRNIMLPTEPTPRLSSSLPTTPLEIPALDRSACELSAKEEDTKSVSEPESSPARPSSRPRVGFSDNVEIIPRPLSTISSETESSMSTIRGHSVNNSISSVLSMTTPSPPSARHPRRSLSANSMASISEQAPRPRSSVEISKRIEKEGEWLKSKSSGSTVGGSSADMDTLSPALTFANSDPPATPRPAHRLRNSLGHSLGFDRRRSEPSISMRTSDATRMSALSLQEPGFPASAALESEDARIDRKSSTRRIKDWAFAKLHRRSRDMGRSQSRSEQAPLALARPQSEGSGVVLGKVQLSERTEPEPKPAMAETDLDAVFENQASIENEGASSESLEPRVQFNVPTFNKPSSFQPHEDDSSLVVDLDAALGPMRTPPMGVHNQKKQLHSVARAAAGPSGYLHRRAESAPTLMPFDFARVGTPSQSSMADVFEEEEEEEEEEEKRKNLSRDRLRPSTSLGISQHEEAGVGISIVDADNSAMKFGASDGLRIRGDSWEPEHPSTPYGNMSLSPRFPNDRRASSLVEDTIVEEASPTDVVSSNPIEIVEDYEEPRASSLTKSSDSSETPTLLASHRDSLPVPDAATPVTTPDTYQTSTFSSPDFARRQGSFDTSRLGTSASSIADNRTMSSCTTGEPFHEVRMSVDDVPSLTSSRSTMLSTAHANTSRRDFSSEQRSSSGGSSTLDPTVVAERRRKRSSIQSLSQLMGGSFGSRTDLSEGSRPQTATEGMDIARPPKKEHRLKKLMFWRSKQSSGRSSSVSHRLQKEPPVA